MIKKGLIFAMVIGVGVTILPSLGFAQEVEAGTEETVNKQSICQIAEENNGVGKVNQALKNMGFNNINEMNRAMGRTNNGINNRCH